MPVIGVDVMGKMNLEPTGWGGGGFLQEFFSNRRRHDSSIPRTSVKFRKSLKVRDVKQNDWSKQWRGTWDREVLASLCGSKHPSAGCETADLFLSGP